jgi:hypothetical protein
MSRDNGFIIDLGPEGGALVARGTREPLAAKAEASYTGKLPGEDREAGGAAEAPRVAREGAGGRLMHRASVHIAGRGMLSRVAYALGG